MLGPPSSPPPSLPGAAIGARARARARANRGPVGRGPLPATLASRSVAWVAFAQPGRRRFRGGRAALPPAWRGRRLVRNRFTYCCGKSRRATSLRSQVVLVTHSEVILDEALDSNLTLLLGGNADNLAAKREILNALKHFGTGHYVKARQRGYVLYVEGRTDLDILKALAERIDHSVSRNWDERINAFYVQDNFPDSDQEAELERVEGGFGVTPEKHFSGLRQMMPELHGLAILDGDGKARRAQEYGTLKIAYWKR